ncbi:hypothetical protein TNCV_2765171 [Trichonephila clavipes]|nr:hypothetical protein TNCV_2765171 [Trichonephila clavipes]
MAPGSRCMSGNTCGCRMSWCHGSILGVTVHCRQWYRIAKDDLAPFHSSPVSLCPAPRRWVVSSAVHVMVIAIPNVLQAGAFVWFKEPLVKVLPVPGWQPMKQLVVRVHFYDVVVFSMTGLSRPS